MREQLILAMARFAGQTLTPEIGREIVAAACGERDQSIPIASMGWVQVGQYIVKPERVAGNVFDLMPIHQAYYESVKPGRADDLDFDYARLIDRERRGEVAMFTARNALGELVGVLRVKVFANMETRKLHATDDMFFIKDDHRGIELAVGLWRFAERSMFRHGVREITFTSLNVNGAQRMAKFLGYTAIGTIFNKVAQDGCDYSDLPTRHRPKVVQHAEPAN